MSLLLLEAFYGGSHKQLIDLFREHLKDCVAYTLPAKKWHWRARTSALFFMQAIPASPSYRLLPDHKLMLRPKSSGIDDISTPQGQQHICPGGTVTPWPAESCTDEHEEGPFSEPPAAAAKARCLNPEPGGAASDQAEATSDSPNGGRGPPEAMVVKDEMTGGKDRPLHIVWPHRWEHDKDPELFFKTLLTLKQRGLHFQLSVLGETFTDVPGTHQKHTRTHTCKHHM